MAGVAAASGGATATNPVPSPSPTEGDPGVSEPPPETGPETASDESRNFIWLIPVLIAGAAVIVIALFALGFLDGTGATTAAPETTIPAATTIPTTTTQPPTTTTTTTPTTTSTTVPSTTIPSPGTIASVGDPIPLSSLTLKSGGIGPIAFGEPADEALGRLVSSIGEPSETGAAGEELGLCEGDDGRFVRWDGLTAVVSGTIADGTFAGYRFDAISVPTMQLDLSTPSGLRVGDTVKTLEDIYKSYRVDYISAAGTDLFQLADGDGLLLWGPVTSTEPSGRVEGIYAPDVCTS